MNKKTIKRVNVPVSIRTRMEKIYRYIKYCQRLEDAYRTKHEEVRTLNDYLIRIQNILPENVSQKCPEVEDIITYIEGLPDIPNTDELTKKLKLRIDEQEFWKEENYKNYNLINRKIEKITEMRDIITIGKNKTIKKLNIKGTRTIPFYREDDKLNDKYGGGFLSSYANLKNPISFEFTDIGKLNFYSVWTAYYSQLSRFIKDKTIYTKYLNEFSSDKLSYESIKTIKKKYIGTIMKNPLYKKEWTVQKYSIMRATHLAKYKLNPSMKKKLKKTSDSYLIYHSNDKYWGDKTGKNRMGKLLMEIRSELFKIPNNFNSIKVSNIRKNIDNNTINNNTINNNTINNKTINNKTVSLKNNRRNIKLNRIRKTKKKYLGR